MFYKRLHNATKGKTSPFSKVTSSEAKLDLNMWIDFMLDFNAMDITKTPSTYIHEICTDGSLQGYGGTYRSHYIQGAYPESWSIHPIHILELYPIFLLIAMFSRKFRNSLVKA